MSHRVQMFDAVIRDDVREKLETSWNSLDVKTTGSSVIARTKPQFGFKIIISWPSLV